MADYNCGSIKMKRFSTKTRNYQAMSSPRLFDQPDFLDNLSIQIEQNNEYLQSQSIFASRNSTLLHKHSKISNGPDEVADQN